MPSDESILARVIFSSREHGRIILNETQPADSGVRVLVGRATGNFGSLAFREIQDGGYSMRFGIFEMSADMTLTTILDAPYLGLFINLGSDFGYSHEGFISGTLSRRQGSMMSVPYLHTKSQLNKGMTYEIFDISFTPAYLRHWQKAFVSIGRVLHRTEQDIPVFERFEVGEGVPGIMPLLSDIKKIVEQDAIFAQHLEGRIHTLLFLLFDLHESTFSRMSIQPGEVERLQGLRVYLEQNPGASVTLKMLAHEVGMNEFKLKAGFKSVFGRPVMRFLFEVRMKKAQELLAARDKPVHEIAVMVGYKNVSSFSAAFKKRFGYPPSAVR